MLFPALASLVGDKEYQAMGEKFEDLEKALLGKGGFEKMRDKIADIEKALGIYDLSQFTPAV